MSQIFSSIGGLFQNHPKLLPGLMAGSGAIFNTLQMLKKQSLANAQMARYKRLQYLSEHPEMMMQEMKKFERPLDQGLVSSLERTTDAHLAEQGLSTAPGIQQEVLAQALAPFKQNQQQMAMQALFKSLGLPDGVDVNIPGGVDLRGLMAELFGKSASSTPSGGTGGTGGTTNPGGNGIIVDDWGGGGGDGNAAGVDSGSGGIADLLQMLLQNAAPSDTGGGEDAHVFQF
jgi:hypothetical protein